MVMLYEGLAGLGIAFLLAVALAEWAKFRTKAEKGFNWLGLAGVWFLFAGAFTFTNSLSGFIGAEWYPHIMSVFEIVGWIFAAIGTLFTAYEVLVEK